MRFSQKFALRVGAVGVAAAAIVVPASIAMAGTTSPTLTAAPNTGLKDGDTVTLSGTGFTASQPWVAVECSSLQPDGSGCSQTPGASGAADGSGNIADTPFTVNTGTQGSGKCKPGSTCYIVVTDPTPANQGQPAYTGVATITFAPFPSITVKPSKGINDGDKVKVTGKDFPANKQVAVTSCSAKTNPTSNCDLTNADTTHTTDGSGKFTIAKFAIHTTASSGKCKPGGKCFVAATTDITGQGADKSQDAVTRIKLAPVPTKTTAKFVSTTSKIVGKVKAGNKGVAGLSVVLDRRKGGKWTKVDSFKTHKAGRYHSAKLHKSGKYLVKTPRQSKHGTSYGASHSKPVHV